MGEGVTQRWRRPSGPLAEQDRPVSSLHCRPEGMGGIRWGDGEGGYQIGVKEWKGGAALKEGKDSVGDLVHR